MLLLHIELELTQLEHFYQFADSLLVVLLDGTCHLDGPNLKGIQQHGALPSNHYGDDPTVTTFILRVMTLDAVLEFRLTKGAFAEVFAAEIDDNSAGLHGSYDVILNCHSCNEVCQMQKNLIAMIAQRLVEYLLC